MATFDLGRVTPLYKGDYSASASYELNDVVLYNGNLYWHVQATATVGILPTDTTVWKLAFADEGVRAEIRGYADDAQDSADNALASKTAAAQSAANASASASQAANSAQTAQTAETGAVSNAQTASTKASEASASASSAASSAQTASDKAALATEKASAASDSAAIATARANAAATSETNAATSAQTATTKASEAAASATSAQEYDESAQQSATNAQTSATNAAASATSAQGHSEAAAQSAEDAAESASRAEAFYYLPTDTAEGAIATFTDGADNVPVKSLVVDIEPVQDLHGYDAPWPGGSQKNLFGLSDFTDTYNGVTYAYESLSGKLSANGTCTAGAGTNVGEITVPEGTYTFSADFTNASGFAQIFLRDKATNANVEEIRANRPQRTVTLNGTYYIRIAAQNESVNSGYVNNIQLELGESKTDFAPYSNICPISGWTGMNVQKTNGKESTDQDYVAQGYPISWQTEAGTVYGGSLDVINGVLTVDRVAHTFTGVEDWVQASQAPYITDYLRYGVPIVDPTQKAKKYAITIATYLPTETESSWSANRICTLRTENEGRYEVKVSKADFPTVTEWKAYLTEHPLTAVWFIATPITYQLTPTEVKSLLGQNNVWADTGDTSVVYRADTSAYIAKKIAEAISALS